MKEVIEHQRAGAVLLESEERFRRLVELLPVAVYVCDTAGRIQSYNNLAVELWGREPRAGDAVQRYCGSVRLYSPDGKVVPHEESPMAEVLRNGIEARDLEVVIERPDGSRIMASVNIVPLRNGKGELLGAINCFEDITDRKRAETALRESEERFRKVFEEGPFGMSIVGLDQRLLRVNDALCALLGYTAEELNGMGFSDITHRDDIQKASELTRQIFAGVIPKFSVEQRLLKQNGQILWVNLAATVIRGDDGRPLYGLGMVKDITERVRAEQELRRSEDRLRLIVDTIPTMAWTVRPDGGVDFINQRWRNYTGLFLEEEIAKPTSAVHPGDLPGVLEQWRADMAAGEPFEYELRLRRADGEYRWFLIRTVPLRDELGNIVKWFGTSTEIEDRKQAEAALRSSFVELRALAARLQSVREEERTRVAREIHDELGQSLTCIKLESASLLRELPATANQQSNRAESIVRLVDETIQMVRRISTELRPGTLDLGLVAAIEWAAEEFEDRTGTTCQLELLQDDIVVDGERATALFRILQETLTNVARHANATRVNVRLARTEGSLILEVRDNGKGISEEARSSGKSLGILGMRERALLLGGELAVSGVAGEGTTVRVRVPETHRTTTDATRAERAG